MKIGCLICLLFLGFLLAAPAVEIQQVPSPDNANSLMIDKSGRHDVLQLRAGTKVFRLFYDDIDALKPYVAKAYGIPTTKLGKIGQPIYKSAKWLNGAQLQIDCASSVPLGDAEHDFDFTAVIDTTGKLLSATIVKGAVISKPTPKPKTTPSKAKIKVRGRRSD